MADWLADWATKSVIMGLGPTPSPLNPREVGALATCLNFDVLYDKHAQKIKIV